MTIADKLNSDLKLAVTDAEGDPQRFAFLLTASLASWMAQGMLDQDTAMQAIRLLHKLHPNVTA